MSEESQQSLTSDTRYQSRKFVITVIQWSALVVLPVIYKSIGVPDDILRDVLMYTTGLVSVYLGFNVLQKKVLGE